MDLALFFWFRFFRHFIAEVRTARPILIGPQVLAKTSRNKLLTGPLGSGIIFSSGCRLPE
jgi:hypothetical protein